MLLSFLKELRNYNRKLFYIRHENKWKPNQHSKLLFLKINKFTLWHIRRNIYIWKTKFSSHNQYLFGLLSSRNAKRLVETKAHYIFCYSVWKETSRKPLTVAATKKSFPSVYVINITCFDECFLSHVIIG